MHAAATTRHDGMRRLQVARGSAWGFFVVGVPRVSPGGDGEPSRYGPVSLRFNKFNPMTQSTPVVHINKEETMFHVFFDFQKLMIFSLPYLFCRKRGNLPSHQSWFGSLKPAYI